MGGREGAQTDRASGSQTVNRATLTPSTRKSSTASTPATSTCRPRCTRPSSSTRYRLRADGTFDARVIDAHNKLLEEATKAMEAAETGARDPADFGKAERQTWGCIVAMSNYEFSSTLGWHGALAFDKPGPYDEAVANPSQYMKLVARVIASRQAAGHPRIAVYSESATQLRILERFLEREGACGERFLYTGEIKAAQRRAQIVHDFLHCARGVMLLSGAGAIGTTICPGCEVLLCVGTVPWNATTLDQAHGASGIGQTRPGDRVFSRGARHGREARAARRQARAIGARGDRPGLFAF